MVTQWEGAPMAQLAQQAPIDADTMDKPGRFTRAASHHFFLHALLAHRYTDSQRGTDSDHHAKHQRRWNW